MRTARSELTAAVAGAAGAGALALSSGGQTWAEVTATRQPPLPPVTELLTGAGIAPLVPATGLVLLAAAVALVAVSGAGRLLVGLLLLAAGSVLAWSGLRPLVGGLDAADTGLPGLSAPSVTGVHAELSAAWPVLAVLGGVLGLLAGVLVVLRGRGWPGMGRRYERSTAARPTAAAAGAARGRSGRPTRPPTDEDRAQAAWKALDRGEDPTDPPPVGRPA